MPTTDTAVKNWLPLLRATNRTYYNLSQKDREQFQKMYKRLKKAKDKEVGLAGAMVAEQYFKSPNLLEYSRKYKAIDILLCNIKG